MKVLWINLYTMLKTFNPEGIYETQSFIFRLNIIQLTYPFPRTLREITYKHKNGVVINEQLLVRYVNMLFGLNYKLRKQTEPVDFARFDLKISSAQHSVFNQFTNKYN